MNWHLEKVSSLIYGYTKNTLNQIRSKYLVIGRSACGLFLIGGLMGVVIAITAAVFVSGVRWLENLSAQIGAPVIQITPALEWNSRYFISLALGAIIIQVIRYFFLIKKWTGPADTIHLVQSGNMDADLKSGFASTIAAFVSAGAGASVGQYGPLVHFGGTMGAAMHRIGLRWVGIDALVGCGVAGAISAGFNAPLAGIIFAHEAILRHFAPRTLIPVATSSIVAAAFGQLLMGKDHILTLSISAPDLANMVMPMLFAGAIFGVIAAIYMSALRKGARVADKLSLSPIVALVICVPVLAIVGGFIPETMGLGVSSVYGSLTGSFSAEYLLVILIAKICLTSLSLSFVFFGGVFSPALLIGASIGGLIGAIASQLGLNGAETAMAIAGMTALAACVIGSPIAAVLIVYELTASYEFALISLLAVLIASYVSRQLYGQSFFDRQLLDRGVDMRRGRAILRMKEIKIRDIYHGNYIQISPITSLSQAVALMKEKNQCEAYCIDPKTVKFVGKLHLSKIVDHSPSKPVSAFVDKAPFQLDSEIDLFKAIEKARGFVGESIPVICQKKRVLCGVVTEADLFSAFIDMEVNVHDIETGDGMKHLA